MSSITVSTSAALLAALKAAQSGETILLAPGTYSAPVINNINVGGAGVIVTSQSTAHEAVLTGLNLANSSGFTFSNMVFSVVGATATDPFRISSSNNVHLTGLSVQGAVGGNPVNDISGTMLIRSSSNVSITNSTFQYLHNALGELNNTNITITGNSFHDIAYDGIDNGGSSNVNISNNTFTNFSVGTTGQHPDAIQFWTTNTTASASNITIDNNTISIGAGDATQGIFMRDEVGNLPFENVTISGNTITGEMYNSIAINGGQNVTISNNNVTSGSQYTAWILADNVTGLSVSHNNAADYVYSNDQSLTQASNLVAGVSQPLTVTSAVSATLGSQSTTLILTGTAKISGRGNGLGDTLIANNAGDTLMGGVGNDTLKGGTGADTLKAGSGADTMSGGGGNDTFVFAPGSGHDTITDFGAYANNHDVINLQAYETAGYAPVLTNSGSNVIVSFTPIGHTPPMLDPTDTITLLGVHANQLIASSVGFTH